MASVNRVILIGNLGKDPDSRYLASGDAVCTLSIATSEQWKDKATGEKKEAVEWHRVTTFGKLAEICGQYLKKGSSVYIEGSLRTNKWKDKDGQDRYTTEIRADTMKMLGGSAGPQPKEQDKKPAPAGGFDSMDSDIPFMRIDACGAWRVI